MEIKPLKFIIFTFFILTTLFASAQSEPRVTDSQTPSTAATETTQASDVATEEKEKEGIIDIREIREKKLAYGLHDEVSDLIKNLTEDKDLSYSTEILALFETVKNNQVQLGIINLFKTTESDLLIEPAMKKIENRYYESKNVVVSAIKYISELDKSKGDFFLPLLEDPENDIRLESVEAICLTGDKKYSPALMELYDIEDEEQIKLKVLLHIGNLKDLDTVEFLTDIAQDTDEKKTSRQYAINSLGLIGAPESFKDLSTLYQENDPMIRMYALSALSGYTDNESEQIIFQALKDENWRIRKEAVLAAGKRKSDIFTDMLIYRGTTDPVGEIKLRAFDSLSKIGSSKAFDYLREVAESKMINIKMRRHAFILCITNDMNNSVKMVDKILNEEWTAPSKTLLEYFCADISKIEHQSLVKYFERMLSSPSVVIRVSGLKGAKINKAVILRDKIKAISEDKMQAVSVRNNAVSALEEL